MIWLDIVSIVVIASLMVFSIFVDEHIGFRLYFLQILTGCSNCKKNKVELTSICNAPYMITHGRRNLGRKFGQ